jgi:Family of unknown function (DUF6220)
MTNALRVVYRFWAALLFLAVLVQIGAAGYGAFYSAEKIDDHKVIDEDAFDHGWSFHTGFGYLVFLAAVVLFLLALASRLGKRGVLWALAAPLLVVVQILLAWTGEDEPVVGILHPINAVVIAGLTGSIAVYAWRRGRST